MHHILGLSLSVSLLALISSAAHAADGHSNSHNIESHVHGLSSLTLAIDAQQIEIQFESPAINLMGFEHLAISKTDIKKAKDVRALLKSNKLYNFNGASCTLVEYQVDTSGILKEASSHHDEHNDHKEHHDHEKHHGHDDHHDEDVSHREIVSSHTYKCTDTNDLTSVSINLFSLFNGIESIQARWITPIKQGASALSSKQSFISLK